MISKIRGKIYDFFHNSAACQKFFLDSMQEEKYAAYYTSMYLLQDTTESLMVHRESGFSENSHKAYIEFWGVMQAIIIQQDSICELYEAITGAKCKIDNLKFWKELRFLRNTCAGHPAKRDRPETKPLTRSFLGRNFGSYSTLTYEQWEKPKSKTPSDSTWKNITHPKIELESLIRSYEKEAEIKLQEILDFMKSKWQNG